MYTINNKSNDKLCMEMMRLTKAYKEICSCVDDLNGIYGLSLLLNFTHDFTLVTSQIFCMFYFWSVFEWETARSAILVLFIWILPNVVRISFMCFACHFTRNVVILTL